MILNRHEMKVHEEHCYAMGVGGAGGDVRITSRRVAGNINVL